MLAWKMDIKPNMMMMMMISIPTHKDGNVLDLVFTNNNRLCRSYNCIQTLPSISHHYIIETATDYTISKQEYHDEVERPPRTRFEELNIFQ